MPDYLTPGYRNSGEGRPVWKRPLSIFLAVLTVLTVLVVVGAAYFFSSDGTGEVGERLGEVETQTLVLALV